MDINSWYTIGISIATGLVSSALTFLAVQSRNETSFRSDLMKELNQLREQNKNLDKKNDELRLEIQNLKGELKKLKLILELDPNKVNPHYLEMLSYVEYLPIPGFIKSVVRSDDHSVIGYRMVFTNRAYELSFGVSSKAYEGQPDGSIWGIETQNQYNKHDNEAVEKRLPIRKLEKATNPKNDKPILMDVIKFPIFNEGIITHVGGMVMGIKDNNNNEDEPLTIANAIVEEVFIFNQDDK